MSDKPFIVIKIGGKPASNLETLDALLGDLKELSKTYSPVLVHGGGADVSDMSRRLGLEPVFVNGLRQTSPEEMQVVEMVLAGSVNNRLLRRCLKIQLPAIGLCGADSGLFLAESADPANSSRTGRIIKSDPQVLIDLARASYLPVVSSVSSDPEGMGAFNINADDAAMALAQALKAEALIFLSDIPGILHQGSVLHDLNQEAAEKAIAEGIITGGMIPKVRSSLGALTSGLGTVIIGGYTALGDLEKFLQGKLGTSLHL